MAFERCVKESFSVIGKEGSTDQGEGFIACLWDSANAHYAEVAPLAKKDGQGNPVGFWGAMSDFSRGFMPWEDGFSRGLYLAGVEVLDGTQAPEGWTLWTIPAQEYLYAEAAGPETFHAGLEELKAKGLTLSGAVQDFTCPETGKNYMFFPIKRV